MADIVNKPFIPLKPRALNFSRRGDATYSNKSYGVIAPFSSTDDVKNGYVSGSENDPYAIWFPSMPEEISLRRTASYFVAQMPNAPDGVHVYRYTSPLEVPMSFVLHAFDTDYCAEGPVTLLKVGALLHSYTLPINDDDSQNTTLSFIGKKVDDKAKSNDGDDSSLESKDGTETNWWDEATYKATFDAYTGYHFPPACFMNVLVGGQYGISCVGYVRDVNVTYQGPWLDGPVGDSGGGGYTSNDYRNLPSSAKYEFTFVNVPTYSNSYKQQNSALWRSAMARDVANGLYNSQTIRRNAGSIGSYGILPP